VYDPKWLNCRTPQGVVRGLAFTLSRHSPAYWGGLSDDELVSVLSHATGRFGSTLAYVLETARCLRESGIRDHELERLVALVRQRGLGSS
jgi:glutathione-specific gamma-glutamylcyclotransferase